MTTQTKHELTLVNNSVYGTPSDDKNLYLIVWERLANSGFIYCWANDELEALALYGYNADYVKHTIIKLNPSNMPLEVGIKG